MCVYTHRAFINITYYRILCVYKIYKIYVLCVYLREKEKERFFYGIILHTADEQNKEYSVVGKNRKNMFGVGYNLLKSIPTPWTG